MNFVELFQKRAALHTLQLNASSQARGPEEFAFRDLFKLCEAYFRCFTHGRWTEAIARAVTTLDQLASAPETHLTRGNVSPPIESYDNLDSLA